MGNPPPRARVSDTPPNASNASSQSPSSKGVGGRKGAVLEVIGVATIPLATMAAVQTRGKPAGFVSPFALDIATVSQYQDPLADAIVELADNYPVLGAALDRLGNITPFGAIVTVILSFGAQIAENHGVLPESIRTVAPVTDRQDLAKQLYEEAAAKQAAAATNGAAVA